MNTAETNMLDIDDTRAIHSGHVVLWSTVFVAIFGVWAWFSPVEEVSSGQGQVIPISHEQVIQSLEGGILSHLNVAAGDIVQKGQILAQLDPTLGESNADETGAKYRAALASAARLQAEVAGRPSVGFPDALRGYPDLIASETALFNSRRRSLQDTVGGLQRSLALVNREIGITQQLLTTGAASSVELLRLQRQQSDIQQKIDDTQSQYIVKSREDLAKANADVASLGPAMRGRQASVGYLTMRSPTKGIVKDIEVTTIGGVIAPNGKLMSIVPLGDQLMLEARISPRDIAFIHPDQDAMVKITAYDYSIYGGLAGKVVSISPDTIRDEVKPEILYYRVYVRTDSDALHNKAGKRLPIVPGMVATVDIRTGSKTVWQYLVKPLNRVNEALRER